jgi:hypothetical protein
MHVASLFFIYFLISQDIAAEGLGLRWHQVARGLQYVYATFNDDDQHWSILLTHQTFDH